MFSMIGEQRDALGFRQVSRESCMLDENARLNQSNMLMLKHSDECHRHKKGGLNGGLKFHHPNFVFKIICL